MQRAVKLLKLCIFVIHILQKDIFEFRLSKIPCNYIIHYNLSNKFTEK